MTPPSDRLTTLVTGGTGKTGRRVAERLQARGVPVRIGSRAGTPAFDWTDEASWAPALSGVEAAYLAFAPDLAVPNAAGTVGAFAEQAVRSGVRRLVLLSGRGEPEAQQTEALVAAAGAEWAVVRSAWFAQNFSEAFLQEPVAAGHLALPVGDVGEPFVDADDVADVAVAALTEPHHAGETYDTTGPELLTFAEAVGEIARAMGREIAFERQTPEAFKVELGSVGLPPDVVWLMDYLFTTVLDGRNAHVGDGVERALGRPPRSFRDYARSAAAAGAWGPIPVAV